MISKEEMAKTVNRAEYQEIVMMRFSKYGVKMEGHCKVKAFTDSEVICDTKDGENIWLCFEKNYIAENKYIGDLEFARVLDTVLKSWTLI